jgi:hypothetical protein
MQTCAMEDICTKCGSGCDNYNMCANDYNMRAGMITIGIKCGKVCKRNSSPKFHSFGVYIYSLTLGQDLDLFQVDSNYFYEPIAKLNRPVLFPPYIFTAYKLIHNASGLLASLAWTARIPKWKHCQYTVRVFGTHMCVI